MKIFILMLFCHILDDFVIQPRSLSELKQKSSWKGADPIYAYDYIAALIVHSLSWSIAIVLPFLFFTNINGTFLFMVILVNSFIHGYVDNEKANNFKINLVTDQLIHLGQIILTYILLSAS